MMVLIGLIVGAISVIILAAITGLFKRDKK